MLNLSELLNKELEKKSYEAAANGDIDFFEEALKIEYFKNFNDEILSNYRIVSIFEIACFQEQIELLDYFFSSKQWYPIFNKTSILLSAVNKSCEDNCLDTIKYLTNSPKIKVSVDLPVSFFNTASQNGNLEIIEYILNNFERKPGIQLALINGSFLHTACSNNRLDVIKFFFNRPKTLPNGFKNIHKEDLFKIAHKYEHHEILEYLIFELDIKMNKIVKQCLKDEPNESVNKMFQQRELNKSLQSELAISIGKKNINKKYKI